MPTALVLVLALAAAMPAAADKESPLDDARLEEIKPDLEALFERVDEAGLPGPLFEAKVREGLVKKVAPEKILAALGSLEKSCLEAKKLLEASGLKTQPAHIGAVSQALSLGVAKKDAARLLDGLAAAKAGTGMVGKSLLVVVMMVEAGVAGSEAVDRVLAIVESGGEKGLDAWIKKNTKSAKKSGAPSKGKAAKKKAKGKAPGKSHGTHGK